MLSELQQYLEQAQDAGLIGPGPIVDHLEHSAAFADLISVGLEKPEGPGSRNCSAAEPPEHPSLRMVDLGSGAGIPGLVLAVMLPMTSVVLLDGSVRRADALAATIEGLGISNAQVVAERAEVFGHDPEQRGSFDVVTARAFGPPAVVAECAAPLLRVGGRLLVSEPPPAADSHDGLLPHSRWPDASLRQLGFGSADAKIARKRRFVSLELVEQCPTRFPRRTGIPQKRPIF